MAFTTTEVRTPKRNAPDDYEQANQPPLKKRRFDHFDPADFFDNERFSDITIKCGDREFKAHKLIVCSKSEYFNTAFGPESKFMEAGHNVYELREDDSLVVERMLRFLYTGDYIQEQPALDSWTWRDHQDIVVVADKYGIPRLRDLASRRLIEAVVKLTTSHREAKHQKELPLDEVCDFIVCIAPYAWGKKHFFAKCWETCCSRLFDSLFDYEAFRDLMDPNEELRDKLYEEHLTTLMQKPIFREMIMNDSKMAIKLLDRLCWSTRLVKHYFVSCKICKREKHLLASELGEIDAGDTFTRACHWCEDSIYNIPGYNASDSQQGVACWVERGSKIPGND